MTILHVLLTLCFPFLILYGVKHNKICDMIGPIVLAYATGIIMSALFPLDHKVSEQLAEASVPLALPLLLFAYPILTLVKQAPKSLIAFGISILSVAIVSPLVMLSSQHPENWKIAGMLVGVYTGGTPNMTGIGLALDISPNTLLLLQTADTIWGGAYLLLLLTVLHRLLLLFLRPYEASTDLDIDFEENAKVNFLPALAALSLSALIVITSAGLSFLIFKKLSVPFVFFGLTTLSLLVSFIPKVSQLKCAYPLGNYLILIFCIAIGQMIKFEDIAQGYDLVLLCAWVMGGTLGLNFILAKVFKVDADSAMMASTAAIYGPAFVVPVAQTMKNPAMIGPGLLMGLLGYALGNYLGLGIAYLVQWML